MCDIRLVAAASGVNFGTVPAAKFTVDTVTAGPDGRPVVCSVSASSPGA